MVTSGEKNKQRLDMRDAKKWELLEEAKDQYKYVLYVGSSAPGFIALRRVGRATLLLTEFAKLNFPKTGEYDIYYGVNHPRVKKLFHFSYKWDKEKGTIGQVEKACNHVRACLDRGYV